MPHAAHITRTLRYFTARLLMLCLIQGDNLVVCAGALSMWRGCAGSGRWSGNCHNMLQNYRQETCQHGDETKAQESGK